MLGNRLEIQKKKDMEELQNRRRGRPDKFWMPTFEEMIQKTKNGIKKFNIEFVTHYDEDTGMPIYENVECDFYNGGWFQKAYTDKNL